MPRSPSDGDREDRDPSPGLLWLRRWLCLGLLLLVACSEAAPKPQLRSRPLLQPGQIIELESKGTPAAGVAPGGALIWSARQTEQKDWIPAVELKSEQDPVLLEALLAGTLFEAGEFTLSAAQGSWLHWIPLPAELREQELVLEGRIKTRNFTGSGEFAFARPVVVEIKDSREPGDFSQLTDRLVTQHSPAPFSENSKALGEPFQIPLRASATTTYLGVFLELNYDREASAAAEQTPTAKFGDLRLRRGSEQDFLSELAHGDGLFEAAEQSGTTQVARFEAEFISRTGLAVPIGQQVRLPIPQVAGPASLVGHIAILDKTDPLSIPGRVLVTAEILATDGDAEEHLWSITQPLELPAQGPSLWQPFAMDLEPDLAGSLVVRLSSEWDARHPDGEASTQHPPPSRNSRVAAVFGGLRVTPKQPTPRPYRNLLMVSLDTVRADHLSLYGYARETDPNLRALAERSTVFDAAWTTSPYTLPSHASLLTAQVPQVHGLERPSQVADPTASTFLAERLAGAGYRTAAFTGGAMLLPVFGFARGFERYGVLDPIFGSSEAAYIDRFSNVPGFDPTLIPRNDPAAIERWIEGVRDEPWFCFVHSYAAHEFRPPARFLEAIDAAPGSFGENEEFQSYLARPDPPPPEAQAWLIDKYDGGIRQADDLLGELLTILERQGARDNTIVVVVSDHGKELGERGLVGHGHQLFEELLHVPALLHIPGRGAERIESPISLADLATTVLAELDLAPLPNAQGRNLFEPAPPEHVVLASVQGVIRSQAMRAGQDKWLAIPELPEDWPVEYPRRAHFQLDVDPLEQKPLQDEPNLSRLKLLDERYRALGESLRQGSSGGTIRDRDLEFLEVLGYTDGQAPGQTGRKQTQLPPD